MMPFYVNIFASFVYYFFFIVIIILGVIRVIIVTVSFLLVLIFILISNKSFLDLEKRSPFECGFSTKGIRRGLFSVHFFLVALIFVIFDVELVILFPYLITINFNSNYIASMVLILVLSILTYGLLIE